MRNPSRIRIHFDIQYPDLVRTSGLCLDLKEFGSVNIEKHPRIDIHTDIQADQIGILFAHPYVSEGNDIVIA